MSPVDLTRYHQILLRKQAELIELLRQRDGIEIEKSADQMDEIQLASERDLAIRNVDRHATLLRQVRSALHRIRDGEFAACLDCEEAISLTRLNALPWARCCIRCQELNESRSVAGDADAEEGLLNVA